MPITKNQVKQSCVAISVHYCISMVIFDCSPFVFTHEKCVFALRNVFTNTVRYIIQNTPTCTFSGFFYVVVTNDCIQQGSNSPEEKLIQLPIFSLNQYILSFPLTHVIKKAFITALTCNTSQSEMY